MAIKIQGETIIDDSLVLRGIVHIDAATKNAIQQAGIGGGLSLTGNTNPFVNSTTEYTITNYNSFTTYSVSATPGSASISGDKITFNAPASAGISVLTVTMGGVDYTFSIAVGAAVVATPTVTVSDGPSNVSETPTLTTSAFATLGASDTHASTTWRIRRVSDSVVVWQSLNNTTNKTSIVVPSGNLAVSTAYVAEAIHNGTSLGASGVGTYSFTTRSQFFAFDPSSVGLPFGGGYYAGKIVSDGKTYAIVVAPKTSGGENSSLNIKTINDPTVGTTSVHNGFANTAAMIAAGAAQHPAANFCNNLVINGYDDWYLPARDELEICYRYLKPTTDGNDTSHGANSSSIPQTTNYTSGNPSQTSVTIFKTGNAEAFTATNYWSSSEYNSYTGWLQYFSSGYQDSHYYGKNNSGYVRAVRRVEIPA